MVYSFWLDPASELLLSFSCDAPFKFLFNIEQMHYGNPIAIGSIQQFFPYFEV